MPYFVLYCMVWYGVVWYGVVWCGVHVWCGVVYGMVWCGVVWCGVVLYCIVLYCEAYSEGRLDRCRIGIPRELSEIRTQPWLSDGSLTCHPCHHKGPIF